MNFYVTFGQRYRNEPHSSGIIVDPDAVIQIDAENLILAHEKAMKLFNGEFHQILTEEMWQASKNYFPHGAMQLILTDGHVTNKNKLEYLGDSVYIEPDSRGIGVVLTTRNGLPTDPSNTIFMEVGVINSFIEYITRNFKRENGKNEMSSL